MAQSFFIWKGMDCRSMGITMRGPAPIIRAEERVKHIEIPGRSGDLTELEGEERREVFNSYIQTASVSLAGKDKKRELFTWLRGSGYLTSSSEPDLKQQARVIGAVTLNKISRNMDRYAGEIQFYCQPMKEKITETPQTILSSDTTKKIINEGDVWAKPLLKVTTTSNSVWIQFAQDGYSRRIDIDMTGLSPQDIYIDCDTMEVYDAPSTGWMTWRSTVSSGIYWPVLYMGENTVTGGGWSKVIVTKRERFL